MRTCNLPISAAVLLLVAPISAAAGPREVTKARVVLGREGHAAAVYALMFSPDGKTLAAAAGDKAV